ncbi:MAG: hypothetical protein OEM21_09040 [Nitrosopumilus sp.]|nr:hypothetical protein [Nitrosopumilus sp.]
MLPSSFANEITQSDSISFRPQIVNFDEKIFLVWTEKSDTNAEIFFSTSVDGGVTFSKPINISNNSGSSAFPRLAVEGNNVYVTWYDYSPGQSDVMVAKSFDSGKTFTSSNISNNISASYNPWISADSEYVYLVWNDGGKSQEIELGGQTKIIDVLVGDSEIMFGISKDKGETFDIQNISNLGGDSINARMITDSNNIYLVWTDLHSNSEIYFSKSNNSLISFSNPINISQSDSRSHNSGIKVYKENVFVIWTEDSDSGSDIYFSKSIDKGNSFTPPHSLSGKLGTYETTRDTQMEISYPHLYIVYADQQTSEVYLSHSPNMGDTFFEPVNLSLSTGNSLYPQIITDENNVFVVWSDDSDGDKDIILRQSSDFGYTFGSKINLSNDTADSELFVLGPQIAKSDNFLDIVFENKTSSNSNLVLIHKPIESIPPTLSILDSVAQINLGQKEVHPGNETNVEIKFMDNNIEQNVSQNYSLVILDSKNEKIFQSQPLDDHDGISNHKVIFPQAGQYSLKLNHEGLNLPEDNEIIVVVVPEFGFGVIMILSMSVSMIIFTKRIRPRIFG